MHNCLLNISNPNNNFNILNNNKLQPYYVTGFCDGESNFKILVQSNSKAKTGYIISLRFSICLHHKDF